MYSTKELCRAIQSISPDVGPCGDRLDTWYDRENDAWVVLLGQGNRTLKTYVDKADADLCMSGRQCLGLGLEIFQLKDNLGFKGGEA